MREDSGPSIHVYIERLILDGLPVDRIQAPHVKVAIETELKRLLMENGLAADLQAGGAVPILRADPIQFRAGSSPTQMGKQIAQSVYSGIGNTR